MKLKDIIKNLKVYEIQSESLVGHEMVYEVEYKNGSTERFNHREWNTIVANGKDFWERHMKNKYFEQGHEGL
tara:strand:- start:32726 stop:32941 length:216 start_codon:yes stop_codon:yes gene_type:complete